MEKERKISILKDIISIKSVNGNEKEVAKYYQELFNEFGISSELIDYSEGRSSIVAEIENGPGKTLVVSGHMDVVSEGNEEDWTYPPFEGHIDEDGVIWGRGASDMKPGLTAFALALINLNESKNFTGKIRFIGTVGEEIGELGAAQLTDKGYIDDADALLIGEPCNVGVVYAHKGSLNYKVISKGQAAHSSEPKIGINAVENLNIAINKIREHIEKRSNEVHDDILGDMYHSFTVIKGGTQVNTIPDYAEFEANVRTIPQLSNDDLINEIQEIIDELNKSDAFDLTLEVTANQPAVESRADSDLIKTILEVANNNPDLSAKTMIDNMSKIVGKDLSKMSSIDELKEIQPMVISGTTDAAQFLKNKKDIEFAVYGPGMPLLNHKTDERINLDQYLAFIDGYTEIFTKYLK